MKLAFFLTGGRTTLEQVGGLEGYPKGGLIGYGHAMDSIGRDNRHTWTHFGLLYFSPCFLRKCLTISKLVAERKGFEPLSPLRGCLISSQDKQRYFLGKQGMDWVWT